MREMLHHVLAKRLLPRPNIPTLVGWDITPDNGYAPAIITADFYNKGLIDGINYELRTGVFENVGSCSYDINSITLTPSLTSGIMANNQFTELYSITTGSCRTYAAFIVDLNTDEIVSLRWTASSNV